MPIEVSILVRGGVVQEVRASQEIDLRIFELDNYEGKLDDLDDKDCDQVDVDKVLVERDQEFRQHDALRFRVV